MKIGNIVINKVENKGKVKAYVTFVLNDCFIIHDARIIEGNNRLFVAMPSKKNINGYGDVCHPLTQELRQKIETAILNEFNSSIEN